MTVCSSELKSTQSQNQGIQTYSFLLYRVWNSYHFRCLWIFPICDYCRVLISDIHCNSESRERYVWLCFALLSSCKKCCFLGSCMHPCATKFTRKSFITRIMISFSWHARRSLLDIFIVSLNCKCHQGTITFLSTILYTVGFHSERLLSKTNVAESVYSVMKKKCTKLNPGNETKDQLKLVKLY